MSSKDATTLIICSYSTRSYAVYCLGWDTHNLRTLRLKPLVDEDSTQRPPARPKEIVVMPDRPFASIERREHLHVGKVGHDVCFALVRQYGFRWRSGLRSWDTLHVLGVGRGVRDNVIVDDKHSLRTSRGAKILEDLHTILIRPVVQDHPEEENGRLANWLLSQKVIFCR